MGTVKIKNRSYLHDKEAATFAAKYWNGEINKADLKAYRVEIIKHGHTFKIFPCKKEGERNA